MPVYFFDTSAISKRYHAEIGTAKVDEITELPGSINVISRLSVVEIHSVFAKKVRMAEIEPADFQRLIGRFRRDVATKRLLVVRITAEHFRMAERMIRRIGLSQNLRTLDALQLATAINLHDTSSATFVCADVALAEIAVAEGTKVINPEVV